MFALLKARGLATELAAGESGMSFSGASLFSVHIVLTDEGACVHKYWRRLCLQRFRICKSTSFRGASLFSASIVLTKEGAALKIMTLHSPVSAWSRVPQRRLPLPPLHRAQ